MKIKQLIKEGKVDLTIANIADANIISKSLFEFIVNKNRTYTIANSELEVTPDITAKYQQNIKKIIDGMPLQYITNNQEFMNYNFYVDKNVLIPQPDTEILVEEVIKIIEEKLKEKSKTKENLQILDMCTGSGCIGISIAKYLENKQINSEVTLADISTKALEIAKKNAIKNDAKNIKIIKTNLFSNIMEKYDIIVSNPPYIETNTIKNLEKQVQNEPYLALDGGKDGLTFYKNIAIQAHKYLKQNSGYLCVEIGYNQKEEVIKIMNDKCYKNIYSKKDLAGNDRIVIATNN